MSVPGLKKEKERLIRICKQAMGTHYPNIWGGEIGQIEKELLKREPKTIYVSWDEVTDAGYRFEIETKRGNRRRILPHGFAVGEEVCMNSDQLRAWLNQLKATHVVSKFNETSTSDECIKDGKYTVAQYIKWWNRSEEDE
jgi:hypothetical protein